MIAPFQDAATIDTFDVVVDLGVAPGGVAPYDAYLAGHLPGAVFVDLDTWLAGPASEAAGRHPLPDPEVFAEGMRRAGIAVTDTVLAYDRVGGVYAARLVWMLRAVGVEAALLDGGPDAYDGELEAGEVRRPRSAFDRGTIPAGRLVGIEEVRRLSADVIAGRSTEAVILDAREGERYRGAPHPLDVVSGHIPGARSLPCREHLDADGRLLRDETLRDRVTAAGVGAGTPVISSCGSGVTACHNLLVLEQLGHSAGRLYPGSWSQWSMGDDLISQGTEPVAGLVDAPTARLRVRRSDTDQE